MRIVSALRAAGDTHPGLQREVNEDRFHVDTQRGLFLVVDGVGGQAAGGKAADVAVEVLRARLERGAGHVSGTVRESIAAANNEIHRLASLRPEWNGMACVLTVAVVHDDRMVVGHVGDTRLYKIRGDRIEKITRDHSPVGEREDAGEISELDAMRNPRRNEVYRDVGSEPHEPDDPDFIDIVETPFEPDAALLLCSDGLTDLVPSAAIGEIVAARAGEPHEVVRALVAAANVAGGKDNVTAVYVEGQEFAGERTRPLSLPAELAADAVIWPPSLGRMAEGGANAADTHAAPRRWQRAARIGLVVALIAALGAAAARTRIPWPRVDFTPFTAMALPLPPGTTVVGAAESIMAAVHRAAPGTDVVVEPGEYRERIHLKDGVRLLSREPRGATIRLPSGASEQDPAVVADGVSGAEMTGFRIVGDAATPLGTGLSIRNANVAIVDIEITGAAHLAIDLAGMSGGTIVGSDIHDNPGAAMQVGSGTTTRITHNSFVRNGTSERARTWLIVDAGARARFSGNILQGIAPRALVTLDDAARAAVARDNWFIEPSVTREPAPPAGRSRR